MSMTAFLNRGGYTMALVDLLQKQVIKIPLLSATKKAVIEELLTVLADAGKVISPVLHAGSCHVCG